MRIISVLILTLLCSFANAQSTYLPVQHRAYHILDRMEIRSGQMAPFHTSSKPYLRGEAFNFKFEAESVTQKGSYIGDSLISQDTTYSYKVVMLPQNYSKVDLENMSYLYRDNLVISRGESKLSENAFINYGESLDGGILGFYKHKAALYDYLSKDFDLVANPVLYLAAGTDQENGDFLYHNTRGVELRGSIDGKVGYYTYITENQVKMPFYFRQMVDSNDAFTGEGFYKPFGDSAYDFFQARGYITFNATKHIGMQFGQDRNFIGNGYRSMLLSDNAKDYLFLKINTKVWKFNYQNLFTEFIDFRGQSGGAKLQSKKFMAMHHLSANVGKNLNIGLFEAIIFDRQDSNGQGGSFDINYLNPIIFYRSVEQGLDSRDNALVGMDFKYNFLRHFSLYGQMMLDEFKISELKAKSGWWANKYAGQLGLKYIDVAGINNLDLQVEVNAARPFIYTHTRNSQNYTHYNQSLAHPLGASFREFVGIVKFQPYGRLNFELKGIMAEYGRDSNELRYGGDLTKDNNNRARDYDNEIGQGANQKYFYGEFMGTYMARHNLFLDVRYIYRNVDSNVQRYNNTSSLIMVGMRLNIEPRRYDY